MHGCPVLGSAGATVIIGLATADHRHAHLLLGGRCSVAPRLSPLSFSAASVKQKSVIMYDWGEKTKKAQADAY